MIDRHMEMLKTIHHKNLVEFRGEIPYSTEDGHRLWPTMVQNSPCRHVYIPGFGPVQLHYLIAMDKCGSQVFEPGMKVCFVDHDIQNCIHDNIVLRVKE